MTADVEGLPEGATVTSYSWYLEGGTTPVSTSASYTVTVNEAGTTAYFVQVTIKLADGTTQTIPAADSSGGGTDTTP